MKKLLISLSVVVLMSFAATAWAQAGGVAAPTAVPAKSTAAAPTAVTVPATPAPVTAAPPGTAQAPAAEAPLPPRPAWLEYHPVYTGEENDMNNPNRTHEEIAQWAQQAAADVLSFSKSDYNAKMASFKRYFQPQGWKLYTAYLTDSRAIDMVGKQDLIMGAIVDELPEIVNQGSAGGAYHWILRMPVTIGFHRLDAEGMPKTVASGKFYLFIDVQRVAVGLGDNGVAIVNWRVMDAPKR